MKRFRPNREIKLTEEAIRKYDEIDAIYDKLGIIEMKDINFMEAKKELYDHINWINKEDIPIKHDKAVNIGMATLRNEEECIRGWAKTMLYFCNEVYALLDPSTTDKTEEILKTDFPTIKILYQDRSLGDSDNEIEGEKKSLIMHANYNYFINELVDHNELFFLLSADERFYTPQFPLIEKEIQYMKDHTAWNGWYIPQKRMYQFYPDDFHVLKFGPTAHLMQFKVFRLVTEYKHGLGPHSGWNYKDFQPYLKSKANWFHYCFVKNSRAAFKYWRDIKRFKDFPTMQFNNPIPFWRVIPELNNKGELNL